MEAVRENDLSGRTLVIFTSDNGGTPRSVNAPLRGFKASTFEGGMRVPTIAWWPGRIPAGTETDAVTGMLDILPTFAALAAAEVPKDRKIDGVNIFPHLAGARDAGPAHETFYYYRGLRLEAVRHGRWKLQIADPAAKQEDGPSPFTPRLYDLVADVGETNDLASDRPEIVAKLQGLIAAMKPDLGVDGPAPGGRAIGRVKDARPLIDRDGTVRQGSVPGNLVHAGTEFDEPTPRVCPPSRARLPGRPGPRRVADLSRGTRVACPASRTRMEAARLQPPGGTASVFRVRT